MLKEENISKLYDGVLSDVELTTKNLNEYGFNSKDLKKLIEEGVIEREKRGLYKLKNIDGLFYYGKGLIAKKEYDKATEVFLKCFKLDPNHMGACFQLFLRSVQNQEYQKAFYLFDRLYETDNEFYKRDLNYYLFLLSYITDIPEKYREFVKHMDFVDIQIPSTDKRYKDIRMYNSIRWYSMKGYFIKGLNKLYELIKAHGKVTMQDLINKELLYQVKKKWILNKVNILSLIKDKKYEDLIHYLSLQDGKRSLTIYEIYCLKIARRYVKMEETSTVFEAEEMRVNDIFEAINTNNFEIAFLKCVKYNKDRKIKNEESLLYNALRGICSLIADLENKEKMEDITVEERKDDTKVKFESIFSYLMLNELDKAFSCLKDYMGEIGRSSYEFLVIGLIKISLLEKDMEYTKPKAVLSEMKRDDYIFDASIYVKEFYLGLAENKLDVARIYLDIISRANKLGQEHINTNVLNQMLEIALASNTDNLIKQEESEGINTSDVIRSENEHEEMKKVYFDCLDVNSSFGIEDFGELQDYIAQSGLDLESACLKWGLTLEEIDLAMLFYAREFYMMGYNAKGDAFLKAFEKSENKTDVSIKLYEGIKRNKKFFVNKQPDISRTLILSLVPNKGKLRR